jgi:hypothetical protein
MIVLMMNGTNGSDNAGDCGDDERLVVNGTITW